MTDRMGGSEGVYMLNTGWNQLISIDDRVSVTSTHAVKCVDVNPA